MAIIGEIIKKAVELSHTIIDNPDPVSAQEKVLEELLDKAKNTAFGKKYNFRDILAEGYRTQSFARSVPYFDYNRIYKEWWKDVYDGKSDITWPGSPGFFALSSGTTSRSKSIPVTDDILVNIRNAGIKQFLAMAEFDMAPSFFEKEILMLGSSTNLEKVGEHLEGEISGISAYNIPFWFKLFYKPGPEISAIENWDERVLEIAKKAPEWDIGGLSGIPSWIELMLKKVVEYNKVNNIHEIWPNLEVYTSGGISFEPFKKSFRKILGREIIVLDTYLASEGYLATQLRKDTGSMTLLTDNGIYFEFVPLKPENIDDNGLIKDGIQSLTIGEVEEDVDYILVISTVSGAWRYMIGDTIRFTDKERVEIEITGRTKYFLNVVGSQLSEIQMIKALEKLGADQNLDIKEFTVCAIKKGDDYIHRWYLGSMDEPETDNKRLAGELDNNLKEINKNYNKTRTKALKDVEAIVVPVNYFYDWAEHRKKKGGQTKVPKVMKEDEFRDWESFIARYK